MLLTRSLRFTLLALALSVWGLPSTVSPHIRHESRRSLPADWTPLRRAPSDIILPLRIGLTQPNIENIESFLLDISHPESPNYGNHWSAAKVAQTFRPTPESVATVKNWLVAEGIEPSRIRMSKAGSWVEANITIAEAEGLLKTEYHVYGRDASGTTHIACDSAYHLPEHISKHVDLITPTLHFDVKLKKDDSPFVGRSQASNAKPGQLIPKSLRKITNIVDELGNCDQHITPNCLRALYDFAYTPLATEKNSIGIVEGTSFVGVVPESYLPTDLDLFFKNFSKSQIGERPILKSIDGGQLQTTEQNPGVNTESDLDLQYAMALVGKSQPVTLYQEGDSIEGASFNNLLDALDGSYCSFEGGDDPTQDGIYPDPSNATGSYKGPADCGTITPAHIISISYGYNEADLTPFYTARQCAEYAKLGLMGVTVLYASGDGGVAGNGGVCLLPDGTQSLSGKMFNPSFPATCPFVTSVGATQVSPGKKVTDPESACEQVVFSGGGFSNYFRMPDYQKNAVNSFLKNHPPPYPTTIWNATGSRALPDISANGANYVVAVDGEFQLIFGTSASTPVTASILYAVNDARLAIGKKPIGFINPTIYSSAFTGAFNDITNGTNQGCGTVGFSAVTGWDPVTGLGTPNFPKLLDQFLRLP